MDFKSLRIITILILSMVKNSQSTDPSISDHHKLLLVTIDALKASYHDEIVKMPGFKYVTENGIRGKYVKPVFPSLTSPCHTTIATGLYPENHGVVHNCYYDIENNNTTHYDFLDTLAINEWWNNDQEPIWITASNQGLKSGGYLFPGSNATINGKSATRSILQTHSTPMDETTWQRRIDDVMSWFTGDGFDFIALYLEQPDKDGHETGPESEFVYQRTLPRVDRIVQYLLKRVDDYNLADDLNIILTSDHGMLNINVSATGDETVSIMKYIQPDWVKFQFCYGPIGLVEPLPEYKTAVYEGLKVGSNHMNVYYKENLHERFHYKLNDRVPSIVVLAKYGYNIYGYFPGVHVNKGEHGHDNDIVDMRTSYYSIGPDFKKGYTLNGFESVNIYPLMCYLLGLKPAPNNGSLHVLYESILTEPSDVTLGNATMASLVLSVLVAIFIAKKYFTVRNP